MIIRNTQALAFDTIAASGNGLEYNMYYREWKTILKTPPSVVLLYSRSQYQYHTLSGKNHYSLAFSLYFFCLEIQPHLVYSGEIYFWIFCPAVIVWKPETFAFFWSWYHNKYLYPSFMFHWGNVTHKNKSHFSCIFSPCLQFLVASWWCKQKTEITSPDSRINWYKAEDFQA